MMAEAIASREKLARTFVVIPAYNEAAAIASVVSDVVNLVPNVVVLDDGSSDGTAELAAAAGAQVLRHVINRGQGAALQTGIEYALRRGAQFIVTFDADGQHCPEDIAPVLDPIFRGECEIVLGSRFLSGDVSAIPPARRLMLRIGVQFTRLVSRLPLTDTHNGLRAFTRRAASGIQLKLDRMAHASELLDQIRVSGLGFREVPVRVRYTQYSLSKGQTARGAFRILIHYLLGRVFP